MAVRRRVRCVLDLGTTTVKAALVEVLEDGVLKVLGSGMAPCAGMSRGQPINVDETIAAIEEAVQQAEDASGRPIDGLVVAMTSEQVDCQQRRAAIDITRNPRDLASSIVRSEHVQTVIEHARKEEALAIDRQYLHVIPQDFTLDGIPGIRNPVGINGLRLEGHVMLVSCPVTATQNLGRCVERAGLSVLGMGLGILGTAEITLRPDERDLGVALLDIGGGTTDLAVYQAGQLRALGVCGIGGENITRDITMALRTPHGESEDIKRRWGCCHQKLIRRDERFTVAAMGGGRQEEISRSQLCQVIQMRVDEILDWVEHRLQTSGFHRLLGAGLVITGGSARLHGLVELASERLGFPVRVGLPERVLGVAESMEPECWTAALGAALPMESREAPQSQGRAGLLARLKGNWKSLVRQQRTLRNTAAL